MRGIFFVRSDFVFLCRRSGSHLIFDVCEEFVNNFSKSVVKIGTFNLSHFFNGLDIIVSGRSYSFLFSEKQVLVNC